MSQTRTTASGGMKTSFGFTQVGEGEKQERVNDVFHKVAQRYDVMNDLMSGGMHRVWKDAMVTTLNPPKNGAFTSLVSGGFALESEGAGFTAAKTQERLLYDLPEDFWSTYRVEIEKLTPEQLLSVGKTVMDRGHLQLIAIGKANALERKLADFGEVRVYDTNLERID